MSLKVKVNKYGSIIYNFILHKVYVECLSVVYIFASLATMLIN